MMTLTTEERAALEGNLFSVARSIVRERPDFPWHRDRGKLAAGRHISSQALAVDFFGTIERLPSRDAIVDAWVRHFDLAFAGGPWTIELERTLSTHLLGEPRPTQIDALATGHRGVIVFEGKFTEPDGGACSQTRPLGKGAHRGLKQCNGNYELQTNPTNQVQSRCVLTAKHIKYWDLVPEVMNLDANADYSPCPFNGPWFQWMRNLVAAHALGRSLEKRAAFVIIYADGPFPMAAKIKDSDDWVRLQQTVAGRSVPMRAVSYQTLLAIAEACGSPADRKTLEALGRWMAGKMDAARLHLSPLDDDSWSFLLQLRTHNILTAADWERILEWFPQALAFLGESNDAITVDPTGEVTIDLDADPREAEWLGILHVYGLTGYRIPGWAALWLLWLAHDRGPAFWSAVASAANNADMKKAQ
jgi:hypothetical protein